MKRRSLAALPLAAVLSFAPLATLPANAATLSGNITVTFDITTEDAEALRELVSWFEKWSTNGTLPATGVSEEEATDPTPPVRMETVGKKNGHDKDKHNHKHGHKHGHKHKEKVEEDTPPPADEEPPADDTVVEDDVTEEEDVVEEDVTEDDVAEDDTTEDEVVEGTTPPATGATTGGSGGPTSDQTFQSFSSNGMASEYHIFIPDTEGPHGLLFWADGSGGFGFDNPNQEYLLAGPEGMIAVAKARNMILVVPEAPAPGCPSDNCWYDRDNAAEKAQWSSDLMTKVKAEHNIDLDRVAIGGYSSGAQWTAQYFMPAHGEEQSVDLAMPMAWGSPGDLSSVSEEYAASTWIVFNTGTNDTNGGRYNAYDGAQAGRDAYRAAGFQVEWEESNSTHDRGGDFGPFAAQNIDQHLG